MISHGIDWFFILATWNTYKKTSKKMPSVNMQYRKLLDIESQITWNSSGFIVLFVLQLENSRWRNQMPGCCQGTLATPLESRCSGVRTTNETLVETECFTNVRWMKG